MPRPRANRRRQKLILAPQILIISAVVLLVLVVLVLKQDRNPTGTTVAGDEVLPAEQLDQALAENRPTLAFFHSDNCQQCIVMMESVARVYPEFNSSITLVDVNVYDQRNTELLREVGLQYIPTLIYYDHAGNGRVSIGVIPDEQLRQTLAELVDED